MDYTFNELCLKDLATGMIPEDELFQFASVCSELFSKGFRTIKLANKNEFLSFKIEGNLTIAEWLKQPHITNSRKKTLSQKLRSIIIGSSKVWDENLQKSIDSCPLVFISHEDQELMPKGLKIACILDTFCVSFSSNGKWLKPYINALWIEESELGETIEQDVKIKHICDETNFKNHDSWIKLLIKNKKLFSDWVPAKNYFPNIDYSNELVKDGDWSQYHSELKSAKNHEEKRSVILTYALKVADRNNYILNSKVSDLNTSTKKKRIIFHAGLGKDRIYLSVDHETGGFEVCDYKGNHLGEFFFDGNQTKPAKKNHSIIVC